MVRRITALALILCAACGGGGRLAKLGGRGQLSYAQYQSLERGMSARAILRAFGRPRDAREQEGEVRGLTYACEDATGRVAELRMVFGPGERLEQWALLGTPEKAPGQAGE